MDSSDVEDSSKVVDSEMDSVVDPSDERLLSSRGLLSG